MVTPLLPKAKYLKKQSYFNICQHFYLGVFHKLRLQEEGARWSKKLTFVNFYTIENANGGGRWSKKDKSFNVVCERPLMEIPYFQLRFVSPLNEMWAYSFISHFFGRIIIKMPNIYNESLAPADCNGVVFTCAHLKK